MFQDFLARRKGKRPAEPSMASPRPSKEHQGAGAARHNPAEVGQMRDDPHVEVNSSATPRPLHHPRSNPRREEKGVDDILLKEVREALKPLQQGHLGSPFTEHIYTFPNPPTFEPPKQIKTYSGDSDPREYLHQFQQHMLFRNAPEEIMCKAFPLYLEGKARGWFQKLPSGSIGSFEELVQQFYSRFFQRKKFTKTVADLMNIRQGRDESLQAYVDRFNDESLQVESRSDQVVISAFMNGLNPG